MTVSTGVFCKRLLFSSVVLLVIGPVSYGLYVWKEGNFDVVAEGRVYRSRQLDQYELARYVREYGIKSILNLRGKNLGSRWYQEELMAAESLALRHYDYGISANRDVADQDLERILAILREAPKPILIHCKSGADRTSLISALYLYGIEGRSPEEAEQQFSMRYGHIPFLGNSTAAMDRAFRRYVRTHPLSRSTPQHGSLPASKAMTDDAMDGRIPRDGRRDGI
ncbi:MAG TPA: dual specificity protein phosphatase family protein [Nitrospiraceae bacterium]|jgi:undecaprenyl-diphosphatase|nr:dual specificity protein phosphatase family protein [Nitrospiraceae bacterium]